MAINSNWDLNHGRFFSRFHWFVYRNTFLIWVYLFAMFFIIATLLGFIIFHWHKISSCIRDSKVCGKMGRTINGVPETAYMPGYNFLHPSFSHPLTIWPKPSSSQVYTETTFEKGKKKPGLVQVCPGHPGHGSTGFCRVIVLAGLLTNSNRSSYRVDQVSGRPAGRIRV